MSVIGRAILVAALACALHPGIVAQGRPGGAGPAKPIVLKIARAKGQLVLSMKPNPMPGKVDMLGMSQLLDRYGADYPVLVLLDSKASLEDLSASGMLAKVGFTNIRQFVTYQDTGAMHEINFGPGIPITDDPPLPPAR